MQVFQNSRLETIRNYRWNDSVFGPYREDTAPLKLDSSNSPANFLQEGKVYDIFKTDRDASNGFLIAEKK